MRVKYRQLDDEALALLRARLKDYGDSRAALARKIGVARSSLSQALDKRYPGDTKTLRAKIFETFVDQFFCPHSRAEIAPTMCKALRERPLSACSAAPADVQHWRSCQACAHNPKCGERKTNGETS